MRFLCIDLGDKRTGLAVCDDDETIASPVGVIEGGRNLYNEITQAIEQYQAQALVFGLPLNMDGSEGDRAADCSQICCRTGGENKDADIFSG